MRGRFTQAYTWIKVDKVLSICGAARNMRPGENIAPTTEHQN